ncbi:Hypothetical Protein FCC1311_006042 [Hondaea fermentalgiana]|uniref:Uncharacterized protein n=1 Tax=Hondaea fermentalgiana TaxID=2315210 RepID=A0A2R5G034_9STRA|nr:Hypothetical Protein FCC1311_006042 [Hondaea fermentalgiana]|eukprot:GBG24386.1 Hypothetical Protein FCC1311_006042 [Hondaea fermentalgiana]
MVAAVRSATAMVAAAVVVASFGPIPASAQPVEGVPYSCGERMPWSTPSVLSSAFVCSGHGSCTSDGACECDSGWTGRSDFVNTQYLDCQIHSVSVFALWGALMFLAVWGQISMWDQIMDKWETFKKNRETRLRAGMRTRLVDNPGLMAVMTFTYIGCPGILAMGMIKFFVPSARIGVSIAPTLLFALVRAAFSTMIFFYQPALLATFLRNSRRRQSEILFLVKLTRWMARANLAGSLFCSFLPIITLLDGGYPNRLAIAVFRLYLWTNFLTVLLHMSQAFAVYQKARDMFADSQQLHESDILRETRRKMINGEIKGIVHGGVQATLLIVFAVVPFFCNKFDYFNPIGWMTYVLIAREIAQSAISHGNSRNGGGLARDPDAAAQQEGPAALLAAATGAARNAKTRDKDREYKPRHDEVSITEAALRVLADDLERGADWVVSDGEEEPESDEDSLDEWGRPTLRSRLSSAADEILAETFQEDAARPTTWFRVITIVAQVFLVILVAGAGFYTLQQLFPDVNEAIKAWALWANGMGFGGTLVFGLAVAGVLLVPGVPGSLVCFSIGAVFEFRKAYCIAAGAHHVGACTAFLAARLLCRTRFEKLLLSRPTLRNMSAAARKEQWRVTFLSRFIVMPVQIKNYLFGVLPVTFRCFFLMAFLGDFQSILFSVYLGSVSQTLLEAGASRGASGKGDSTSSTANESGETSTNHESWLPMLSLLLAIIMTTIASIVARRSYMRVLAELKTEETLGRPRRRSSDFTKWSPASGGSFRQPSYANVESRAIYEEEEQGEDFVAEDERLLTR